MKRPETSTVIAVAVAALVSFVVARVTAPVHASARIETVTDEKILQWSGVTLYIASESHTVTDVRWRWIPVILPDGSKGVEVTAESHQSRDEKKVEQHDAQVGAIAVKHAETTSTPMLRRWAVQADTGCNLTGCSPLPALQLSRRVVTDAWLIGGDLWLVGGVDLAHRELRVGVRWSP